MYIWKDTAIESSSQHRLMREVSRLTNLMELFEEVTLDIHEGMLCLCRL